MKIIVFLVGALNQLMAKLQFSNIYSYGLRQSILISTLNFLRIMQGDCISGWLYAKLFFYFKTKMFLMGKISACKHLNK